MTHPDPPQVQVEDGAVRNHLIRMIAALSHDLAATRAVVDTQADELVEYRRKERVAAATPAPPEHQELT